MIFLVRAIFDTSAKGGEFFILFLDLRGNEHRAHPGFPLAIRAMALELADLFEEADTSASTYPLHELDETIFGDDWKRQMEMLDGQPTEALYQEESHDGFIPMDWAIDDRAICDTLDALGMDSQRLKFQQGDELGLVIQVLNHLGLEPKPEQVEWHRRNMVERIEKIVRDEPLAKRLRGDHLDPGLQRIADQTMLRREEAVAQPFQVTGSMAVWVPLPGTRNKGQKSAHVPGTREQQEKQDRDKWAKEVLHLMQLASAPLFDLVSDSFAPELALLGALGATRGSTMEAYFKALKPFLRWLEIAHKLVWPTAVVQLVDFLHDVGMRPCAPTYPARFGQALSWTEKVGGWESSEQYSGMALFLGTVKYWTDVLSAGLAPLKQAPRLPWCLVASLELLIVNDQYPRHVRFKAWTMLLKHWATLREDDIQHAVPGRFRLMGDLLVTELQRTKTTGAAKRVRQLPVGVWIGATITCSMWIEVGLALMDELTKKENDFLLPRFQFDGKPLQTPMTYSESASMTRLVMSLLKVPRYDVEAQFWKEDPQSLLAPELYGFWTEHSPRAGMPSSAQVLGIHKDEANFLGRWSPSGAEDYSRAYRVVIQKIQTQVWKEVLAGNRLLREHDVIDRLGTFGKERGWSEGREAEVRKSLEVACGNFWEEVGKLQGPPEEVAPDTSGVKLNFPIGPASNKASTERAEFILVYGRNRRTAKLHKIDGCQWTSIKFADSREISKPTPEMYSSRCKLCWPKLSYEQSTTEYDKSSSDSEL